MIDPFKNNEKLRRWRHGNITCYLYNLGYDFQQDKYQLGYRFFWKGQKVFEGSDFYASPLHSIDSIQTLYALLGFLTLRPGDTDKEYFDNYTPLQLEWCNSNDCESLQCWVSDREK